MFVFAGIYTIITVSYMVWSRKNLALKNYRPLDSLALQLAGIIAISMTLVAIAQKIVEQTTDMTPVLFSLGVLALTGVSVIIKAAPRSQVA